MKDEILKVKKEIVVDCFGYKGEMIAILANDAFPTVEKDVIIFSKLVEENDDLFIRPIDDEEYEAIAKYYKNLQKIYKE